MIRKSAGEGGLLASTENLIKITSVPSCYLDRHRSRQSHILSIVGWINSIAADQFLVCNEREQKVKVELMSPPESNRPSLLTYHSNNFTGFVVAQIY